MDMRAWPRTCLVADELHSVQYGEGFVDVSCSDLIPKTVEEGLCHGRPVAWQIDCF
ncbi:unnamed protein product [Calypogeia fissa]